VDRIKLLLCPLPGVLILELRGAEIAERRVQPNEFDLADLLELWLQKAIAAGRTVRPEDRNFILQSVFARIISCEPAGKLCPAVDAAHPPAATGPLGSFLTL
jgi:hypothetical protein